MQELIQTVTALRINSLKLGMFPRAWPEVRKSFYFLRWEKKGGCLGKRYFFVLMMGCWRFFYTLAELN